MKTWDFFLGFWKLVKRNHLQVFHVFCLSLASCFAFTFMEKLTKNLGVSTGFFTGGEVERTSRVACFLEVNLKSDLR